MQQRWQRSLPVIVNNQPTNQSERTNERRRAREEDSNRRLLCFEGGGRRRGLRRRGIVRRRGDDLARLLLLLIEIGVERRRREIEPCRFCGDNVRGPSKQQRTNDESKQTQTDRQTRWSASRPETVNERSRGVLTTASLSTDDVDAFSRLRPRNATTQNGTRRETDDQRHRTKTNASAFRAR
jgi:hypothetical protein